MNVEDLTEEDLLAIMPFDYHELSDRCLTVIEIIGVLLVGHRALTQDMTKSLNIINGYLHKMKEESATLRDLCLASNEVEN